jgi:hypothetical protein
MICRVFESVRSARMRERDGSLRKGLRARSNMHGRGIIPLVFEPSLIQLLQNQTEPRRK